MYQDLLKQAGLPQAGKKVDLIQRLTDHDQRGEALDETEVATVEQQPEAVAVPVDDLVLPEHPHVNSVEVIAQTTAPVISLSPAKIAHDRDEDDDMTEPVAKRVRVDDDVAMADAQPIVAPPPTETPLPPPSEPAPPPPVEPSILPEAALEVTAAVVEEEEEPPVYEFDAEEETGQPTDLYLDTVSIQTRVESSLRTQWTELNSISRL